MDNYGMNETVQTENTQGATPVFSGGGAPNYGQMPQGGQTQGNNKMSTGKRVGYGFLSLAPFVACIALQFAVVFVVMVFKVVVEVFKVGPEIMADMDAYMQLVNDVIMDAASSGTVAYHVVGTIVFGIWYYFSFKKPRPSVKGSFKKLTGKNVLISVVCGICLCFFANGTVCIEYVLVPEIVESYIEMAEMAGLGTDLFVILAAIILAPMGEEFVCRGLTQKFAKKAFGKFWIANILQAFLFGLMHMNWVQGIYAFVIGLVLGWLTERYECITLAMIVHFVVNFSSSTWIAYVLDPALTWLESVMSETAANLVAGSVLIIVPTVIAGAMLIWGGKKEQAA